MDMLKDFPVTRLISLVAEGERYNILSSLEHDSLRYTSPAVHEWRRYIPEGIVALWGQLSDESRLALYLTSKEQADREEWN